MRELRREKTQTVGSRNVLPRLLTKIQAMWLLDIRERSDERQREHNRIVPLELALEHMIVAQRLSGRWYFAWTTRRLAYIVSGIRMSGLSLVSLPRGFDSIPSYNILLLVRVW